MTKNIMKSLHDARLDLLEKMSEVPRTIVYIDDNAEDMQSFKEFFSNHAYNIKLFRDPTEAFYWIKHNTTDLIISNVNLPGLSGISLLRKIRLNSKLAGIPFILISNNSIAYIPDARKAKANDLYQKPLNYDKILTRIKFLSKIKVNQDSTYYLIQKTWSRRIYPGHLKRLTSFFMSLFLLLLFSPILILISCVLWLHKTKPLVKISKIGAGYDKINLYNFNTPVSKFGSFLKRTNLVRWPELFNVLLGDLSIIGNKALNLKEAELYTSDRNSLRFLAPTGLTGARHTYDTNLKKSIQHAIDLENYYALQRNLFYDIFLFLKSIPYLFKPSNHKYYDLKENID